MPDDNAYERRSQAQAATAAPDAMDVELAPAPRAAAPAVAAPSAAEPAARLASLGSAAQRAEEGAREQAAGEDEEERARGKLRKRVRFAADAAPQPAEDESSSGAARWPWTPSAASLSRACRAPWSAQRSCSVFRAVGCVCAGCHPKCTACRSGQVACKAGRSCRRGMCMCSISYCMLIDESA